MPDLNTPRQGRFVHVVTLDCRDAAHADRCLAALNAYGRPDAEHFGCVSYDFGLVYGTTDKVCIVERWNHWEDLDALLVEKVIPALPMYNDLLKRPFDPGADTLRISLTHA